jgi:hypothetical protein
MSYHPEPGRAHVHASVHVQYNMGPWKCTVHDLDMNMGLDMDMDVSRKSSTCPCCHALASYLLCPIQADLSGLPVQIDKSCKACPGCLAPVVLSQLFCPYRHVLAVLSSFFLLDCPLLLSCPVYPIPTGKSQLPCPSTLVSSSPVPPVLSLLPCCNHQGMIFCPVPAVLLGLPCHS